MGLFDFIRGNPTEEKLAGDLIAIARREGDSTWRYVAEDCALRNASSAYLNLSNIFLEYSQADRSSRPALLEKYASMMVSMGREAPALWSLAQKSVYPVLRFRHDLLSLEIEQRGTDAQPMRERALLPFHGDLVIRIAYDFGQSVAQVTTEQIETWGAPMQNVYECALRNLRALEKPRWVERAPGLWQIESNVSYEESMLLLDDVLDRLEVRGDLLLLPSNRGVLFAVGSEDPAAIDALLDAAREALLNNPWPLPPQLLRRRGRSLEPAALDDAFSNKLEALRTIDASGAYADQKTALDKWLERTGRDIFVASYQMTTNEQRPGAITSYCTWTEGAHSWLPRSDLIALNRDLGKDKFETIFVPWPAVESIVGGRLAKIEEVPVRFEVKIFPNADEWRRLQAAAVS